MTGEHVGVFWKQKSWWVDNCQFGQTDLYNKYGGSPSTWKNRMRVARKLDAVQGWGLPWAVTAQGGKPIPPGPPSETPQLEPAPRCDKCTLTLAERVGRDAEVMRLKSRIAETESKYGAVVRRGNLHEDVLETVRWAIPAYRTPEIVTPTVDDAETVEDAILGWADAHAGETISYEVMNGLNTYGPLYTCRRYQATVDKTIQLLFGNHRGTKFEHLFVFDLGDSITGDLLEDNKATNAIGVFESMRFSAEIKARALTELSAYLPVTYVSVPGNHGRRGPKMPWKQPTETADWLIGEMVALHCRDNDRIECIVPKSWSAVVNIRGHNHWLNHGYAAAKGGNGGIPWYAYMRRDGKMTALEATQDQRIHYRWYGHIHTQAEIPKMGGSGEQFIIGSLKGGDEYALNELGEYGDPVQKLVGCHEKYGVSWRQPINVNETDDVISRYEDAIPVAR